MRKTKEILRLKAETDLSQRAIARAVGVSNATITDVLHRLEASGLAWPLPEGMGDAELEARLYRPSVRGRLIRASPTGPRCTRSCGLIST